MCILCEPKYEINERGFKKYRDVANKIIYHPERHGADMYEVIDEPQYDGVNGGFYIVDGNELHARADDPYCGAGPLTINYCPICGRKLEHKENLNEGE